MVRGGGEGVGWERREGGERGERGGRREGALLSFPPDHSLSWTCVRHGVGHNVLCSDPSPKTIHGEDHAH